MAEGWWCICGCASLGPCAPEAQGRVGSMRLGLALRQLQPRQTADNRHTARASIALPSPTGPIFSAVLALTLT